MMQRITEAHSELCQRYDGVFCEKHPSWMFDNVLNTPLLSNGLLLYLKNETK